MATLTAAQKHKRAVALYPGRHPALVDQATFDRCQEVRQAWGTAVRGRDNGSQTRVYLLSGLLRCGQCGGMMRAQSTATGYPLLPLRHPHRAPRPSATRSRSRPKRSRIRWSALLRGLRLPPDWREQLLAQPSPPQELARRDAERAQLEGPAGAGQGAVPGGRYRPRAVRQGAA